MAKMGGHMVEGGLKETNNFKQGRTGSGTPKLSGPAKSPRSNPTQGGGINRSTKGMK